MKEIKQFLNKDPHTWFLKETTEGLKMDPWTWSLKEVLKTNPLRKKDPGAWSLNDIDLVAVWISWRIWANKPATPPKRFNRLLIRSWLFSVNYQRWSEDIEDKRGVPAIAGCTDYDPKGSVHEYLRGDKILSDLTKVDWESIRGKTVSGISPFIWKCLVNFCRDARRKAQKLAGLDESIGENNVRPAPSAVEELIFEEDELNEPSLEQIIKLIESKKAQYMVWWEIWAEKCFAGAVPSLSDRRREVFILTYGESPNFDLVLYPRRPWSNSKLESAVAKKYDVNPWQVIWLPWEVNFATSDPNLRSKLEQLGIEIHDKETLFLILPPPRKNAQEAAKILGLTANNVGVIRNGARQRIRQFFHDSPGP